MPWSLLLSAAVASADNALQNAGFEQATHGWRAYGVASRYQVVSGGRQGGHALRYRKTEPGDSKENSHFDQQVAVRAHTGYVAGVWVKSSGPLRPVMRIADMDWQTLAMAGASADAGWQELRVLFDTAEAAQVRFQLFGGAHSMQRESAVGESLLDDAYLRPATDEELDALTRARVTVHPDQVVGKVSPLFFGVNSLFMVEDDAALADERLTRLLRDMPCRLLRYPGGEMADNYHWKTHLLDDPKRWPMRQGPDTTDSDEFMTWCRKIGAEPIFVVNLESAFVHKDLESGVREAAEWVAYCNRDHDYNVRFWEIGNETYLKGTRHPLTARQYAEAFVRFARAMKAVDSSIQVGANGPRGPNTVVALDQAQGGDAWWPTLARVAGPELGFAIVHEYRTVKEISAAVDVGRPVAALHAFFRDHLRQGDIPVALTEWNTSRYPKPPPMENAVAMARLIHGYLRGGVQMANFWPLRLTGSRSTFRALVDRETNSPLPPYQVLHLYASHCGRRRIAAETDNRGLDVLAVMDDQGRQLHLFLINKSRRSAGIEVAVRAPGFALQSVQLLGRDAADPQSVTLRSLPTAPKESRLARRLPPVSVAAAMLQRR